MCSFSVLKSVIVLWWFLCWMVILLKCWLVILFWWLCLCKCVSCVLMNLVSSCVLVFVWWVCVRIVGCVWLMVDCCVFVRLWLNWVCIFVCNLLVVRELCDDVICFYVVVVVVRGFVVCYYWCWIGRCVCGVDFVGIWF